jgi:hypothetical protein
MARAFFGTSTSASGGTAVRLLATDSNSRVVQFMVRSRAGNTGTHAFGHSSAISSVSGWQLASATTFPTSGDPLTFPVTDARQYGRSTQHFWVRASASSVQRFDFYFLLDP